MVVVDGVPPVPWIDISRLPSGVFAGRTRWAAKCPRLVGANRIVSEHDAPLAIEADEHVSAIAWKAPAPVPVKLAAPSAMAVSPTFVNVTGSVAASPTAML